MTSPKRTLQAPPRQGDARRNLVTAHESLDRAARRLAGVKRQVLERVEEAPEPLGGEASRR